MQMQWEYSQRSPYVEIKYNSYTKYDSGNELMERIVTES